MENVFAAAQAAMEELRADFDAVVEDLAVAQGMLAEEARLRAENDNGLDVRVVSLEAWRASGGGGTPGPDPDPPAPPTGTDPGDGIAKSHDHLVWLAAHVQPGGTIRVKGKFKTATILIRQPGVTVEGVSPPNADGTPADELIWDSAHVIDSWDKGILVFNLLPELRHSPPQPGDDIIVRNLLLRGAKAKDGNGAGIRIDGLGSGATGKTMWRNVIVQNVWTVDCQNGGLTVCSGDMWLINIHVEGWGQAGQTHGWYHTNQNVLSNTSRLFVRGFYSRRGSEGHPLKYRCGFAHIVGYYVESTGNESYEIDACQGGIFFIDEFEITQGKRSPNKAVIAYGEERSKGAYATNVMIFGRGKLRTLTGLTRNRWVNPGSGLAGKPPANVEVYGWQEVEKIWEPASLKSSDPDPMRTYLKKFSEAPALDVPPLPVAA